MRACLLLIAGCGRLAFDARPADDGAAPDGGEPSNARAISAGVSHTCAIALGELYCWGANENGQLGLGDTDTRLTPARVGADTRWTHVTAGAAHTCGARSDGVVLCWGGNDRGQLGVGDTSPRLEPTVVATFGSISVLHARFSHTCLVHDDGELSCWGANFEGELGLGDPADSPDRLVPSTPLLAGPFLHVSTGGGHTLAITASMPGGPLYGTGRNTSDQLGLGDTAPGQTRELTQIEAFTVWTRACAGQDHSCGIRADRLACWGANAMGQLGTDDLLPRSSLALVDTEFRWVELDCNTFHTCATRDDGVLACWGRNVEGQLGTVDRDDQLAPAITSEFTDWTAVSTGRFHTCALRTDGSTWCTGNNLSGQLGTGDLARALQWKQLALP